MPLIEDNNKDKSQLRCRTMQISKHKWIKTSLVAGVAGLMLTACSTSPTGRSQLKLFPTKQINEMGVQSFTKMKEDTPASKSGNTNNYVNCVAQKIIAQVPAEFGIPDWEVVVFDSEQVNAFALPGGKVGVYTGLLEVAENQHQLAAVIGHELAHVMAEHGNERVSTAFATQATLAAAYQLSGDLDHKQEIFALLGVGAQVGISLPFGRIQESEADAIGLDLMARAGFDPKESVTLWQNMGKKSGKSQPEFLSTHPSNERRINDLNKRMVKVMPYFKQARAEGRNPQCTV